KALTSIRGSQKVTDQNPEAKYQALEKYARDLTEQARRGKLDPVIGRDEEIRRVVQVLSRRTKNNPALIGEPGVGKTAIVEGLAQRIVAGDVPEQLQNKRLVALDIGALVAGTKYRGEFEERLKKIVAEVKETSSIIFSDEALKAAAGLAARYVTDRFMPDKAIDLIDEAASRVRMYRSASPPSLKEAMRGLEALRNELEAAIAAQDFDLASALRDRERKLKERISGLEKDWKDEQQQDEPVVTEEDIAQVVSMWTGIPLTRIAGEESERLLQ